MLAFILVQLRRFVQDTLLFFFQSGEVIAFENILSEISLV
jgi:hypothetical protein